MYLSLRFWLLFCNDAGQRCPQLAGTDCGQCIRLSVFLLCADHTQCLKTHKREFKWGQEPLERGWNMDDRQCCVGQALRENSTKPAMAMALAAIWPGFQIFGPWRGPCFTSLHNLLPS